MALILASFTLLMGAKPGLAGPAGPICRGSGLKKQVALTFDDGPHPSFTPQILSLLNQYAVQATFFVLGEHAAQYPGIIRELVDSGQEVENHSFTHLRFPSKDDEAWPQEIERTELELDFPTVYDGARGVFFVERVVESGKSDRKWTTARWK